MRLRASNPSESQHPMTFGCALTFEALVGFEYPIASEEPVEFEFPPEFGDKVEKDLLRDFDRDFVP